MASLQYSPLVTGANSLNAYMADLLIALHPDSLFLQKQCASVYNTLYGEIETNDQKSVEGDTP